MRLTPRQKLVGVNLSLGVLLVMAATQGAWSLSGVARLVLGVAAVAGLGVWVWRTRGGAQGTSARVQPRLKVLQRVGLSQRNALALIEVDGRSFIVVHGDGFARIRPAPGRAVLVPHRRALAGHEELTQ